MKCSACARKECDGDNDYEYRCVGDKEGIDCTCTCHESIGAAIFSKGLSILGGVAATVGGIALTVATGGAAAIIGGAVIAGAGSSLAFNPITKMITGERMTIKDTATDVALGATIGVVTCGIGAGGGALAKGASTVAKLGIRAGAGSVAGAASSAISAVKDENVTVGSFAKSVAIGAVVGTVAGAAAHTASAASNKVTNEVGKIATRVSVQGGTAAATDATLQLIQTGKIDPKQTLLMTAGQISMATAAEATSAVSQTSKSYGDRVNKELLKDSNLSAKDSTEIKRIIGKADNVDRVKLDAGKKIGTNSIHKLVEPRDGQVGAIYGAKGERGIREGRVILQEYKGNHIYVDHTPDHKYNYCKPALNVNDINNPLKGTLRADQLRVIDKDED